MGHLTAEQLKQKLIEAEKLIDKSSRYFHYKHPEQYYSIEGFCLIEETEEVGVLYKPLYGDFGDIIWLRPISVFLEKVEIGGKKIKRFNKI
ncbi:MAG: DUF1653 domain-containing protein [Candidatus Dojkabacteria bacterium]